MVTVAYQRIPRAFISATIRHLGAQLAGKGKDTPRLPESKREGRLSLPNHPADLPSGARLDLGAYRTYMDEVFGPLTEAHAAGSAIEGLSRAHLSPRQYAIMSPWMLANRATEDAFEAIESAVEAYQQHWFELLRSGVSQAALENVTPADLQQRNLRNKQIIFDPDVDPVWERITSMIGEEAVAIQRALLIGEDE